jgi:hypothetical protein
MNFNCLSSYNKIQEKEGANLLIKKDRLIIKLFCWMQDGVCETDICYFFNFKTFYSDIVKLSTNNAAGYFHSNICEYAAQQ